MILIKLADFLKKYSSTAATARALGISPQRLNQIVNKTSAEWYVLESTDGYELLRQMHKQNKGA